jgi:hypothetical protein
VRGFEGAQPPPQAPQAKNLRHFDVGEGSEAWPAKLAPRPHGTSGFANSCYLEVPNTGTV